MALTKLIDCDSFFHNDEPTITIIDFSKTKGFIKSAAADDRITEYASNIKPDPSKVYVHILAMSAGEYWGANRNSDFFPEENLIKCHETFYTTPAHIFKNHVNKNPAIAIGQVVFSIYNHRMHRVEVIAYIDRDKGWDIVDKLESGEFPKTSMACRTPWDECSVCGNKARTRMEYCKHLSQELGRIYQDGSRVMALNTAPLTFFDMSWVLRPADPVSSVLQKLATAGFAANANGIVAQTEDGSEPISSAEIAEREGLDKVAVQTKRAGLRKISEMVKEVEGEVAQNLNHIEPILDKVQDPAYAIINSLSVHKLEDTLETMAHLGISPSIAFLAELIIAKKYDQKLRGLGHVVESMVDELGPSPFDIPDDISAADCPRKEIANILCASLGECSLLPEFVEKRASYDRIASNIGYIGNGPIAEPSPYEYFKERNGITPSNEHAELAKMMKAILEIGGTAIAAKMFINRAIEEKVREMQLNQGNSSNPQVKIILVKSASDYAIANRLIKASTLQALTKNS